MNKDKIAEEALGFLIDDSKIKASKAHISIKYFVKGNKRQVKKYFNSLYRYVSYCAGGTKKVIHNMDFPGGAKDVMVLEVRYKTTDDCATGWERWEQYKDNVFG